MQKGPLVYAAVILAALLLILSLIMALNRDFFLANSGIIMGITGVLALLVVAVLVVMLIRIRKYKE